MANKSQSIQPPQPPPHPTPAASNQNNPPHAHAHATKPPAKPTQKAAAPTHKSKSAQSSSATSIQLGRELTRCQRCASTEVPLERKSVTKPLARSLLQCERIQRSSHRGDLAGRPARH